MHSNLLVLAPHPDDELLACHQIVLDALSFGYRVRIVYVSSSKERYAEASQYLNTFPASVQHLLSYERLFFTDGSLWRSLWLIKFALRKIVLRLGTSYQVLAPHCLEPISITSDHLAVHLATRFAVPADQILYWQIWANVRKGKLPAPRKWLRKAKWLLRSFLPQPKAKYVRKLTQQEQTDKLALFTECYASQLGAVPHSLLALLAESETLY